MTQRLTRKQAAIIGAHTGRTYGPFGDLRDYVGTLEGFKGITDTGMMAFQDNIAKAAAADAASICANATDPVEEPNDSALELVSKVLPLVGGLYERFPNVPNDAAGYLQAIDTLIEASKAEPTMLGAFDTELVFKEAIRTLQPPAEKKDPHAATVRKVLNSVWEAYEKLKQGEQP